MSATESDYVPVSLPKDKEDGSARCPPRTMRRIGRWMLNAPTALSLLLWRVPPSKLYVQSASADDSVPSLVNVASSVR